MAAPAALPQQRALLLSPASVPHSYARESASPESAGQFFQNPLSRQPAVFLFLSRCRPPLLNQPLLNQPSLRPSSSHLSLQLRLCLLPLRRSAEQVATANPSAGQRCKRYSSPDD